MNYIDNLYITLYNDIMKQNDLKVNEKVGVKFESFRNRRQCGR